MIFIKKLLKKIYAFINLYRGFFAAILYLKHRKVLNKDVERYLPFTPYKKVSFMSFYYTLIVLKQFRSVFYMRASKDVILSALSKVFIKPLDSIEIISKKIGPGLLIFHKFGSVIFPCSAGENLTIAQGVTIGSGHKDAGGNRNPIIGNNVWIAANAVVFGPITIGNDVTIGAGCVLSKSVPDNCTVAGNPARIIKKDGIKCDIPL